MATGVKPGGGAAAPEESLWDVDFEKADLRIGARRTRDLCTKKRENCKLRSERKFLVLCNDFQDFHLY